MLLSNAPRAQHPRWLRVVLFCLLLAGVALVTFGIQSAIIAAGQPVNRLAIGQQLLKENRPLEAALVFQNPEWQAVAHYQAARYRRAAQIYQTVDTSEATYNYGVSVARLRRWDDAIAAFRVVLDEHPDHEDAQFNYSLLMQISTQEQAQAGSNSGADQGGDLREDSQADGEPNAGSERRPENDAVAPELAKGSDAPAEQGEASDPSSPTSGQDSQGSRRQSMDSPPAEPTNPSLANLGQTKDRSDNRSQDNTDETVTDKTDQAEETALTEAMKMRKLSDNASVVLKARLRASAQAREAARR